jgi:hypothetical protein
VKVTICPPGEAIGARDLQRWASRRSAGRGGLAMTRGEREKLEQWTKPKKDAADRWLAKHERGRR